MFLVDGRFLACGHTGRVHVIKRGAEPRTIAKTELMEQILSPRNSSARRQSWLRAEVAERECRSPAPIRAANIPAKTSGGREVRVRGKVRGGVPVHSRSLGSKEWSAIRSCPRKRAAELSRLHSRERTRTGNRIKPSGDSVESWLLNASTCRHSRPSFGEFSRRGGIY